MPEDTMKTTQPQRRATLQAARAIQRALLVDLDDRGALQRTGEAIAAAVVCAAEDTVTDGIVSRIKAITVNTRERSRRYIQYNGARSGSVTSLPLAPACE
jgi:alpha-beta hydrolase superfamily lysophospholipase